MADTEYFSEGTRYKILKAKVEDLEEILEVVGLLLVEESGTAFRDQKMGNVPWVARMLPNVPGIMQDFDDGRPEPKARRFDDRPVLVDTGDLARSIDYWPVGKNAVEAGTNLDYAQVLHSGGESETVPMSKQIRRLLWKWLKGSGKEWARTLGWMLNKAYLPDGDTITINHPPRPVVALTPQVRKNIKAAIGLSIVEVKK